MRFWIVLVLATSCVAALPARAAEFMPGWSVETVWDSNVLRTSEDETADYSIRTGPNVRVREDKGDLRYDLSYRPRYEAFIETEGINEFDQFVEAGGSWQIDASNEFQFSNSFAYTSSLSGLFETAGFGPGTVTVVVPRRDRITVNTGFAAFTHRLGPLWQVDASLSSQLYEYEQEFEPDSLANGGALQLSRSLTPRLRAGFGGQVQRQDFDAVTSEGESSGTTFYQGFGSFSYAISRTWSITANAGPAWSVPDSPPSEVATLNYAPFVSRIRSGAAITGAVNPNTCSRSIGGFPVFDPTKLNGGGCGQAVYNDIFGQPIKVTLPNGQEVGIAVVPGQENAPRLSATRAPFDGDIAEGALSYFGRLTMQKSWQRWVGSLSFERNASTSSGVGGSTILTSFTGNLRWTPTREWTIDFDAVYTTQTSANDVREQLWQLQTDASLIPPTFFDGIGPAFPDPVGVPFSVVSGDEIDNAIDIVTYRFELVAERRIGRHLRVFGRASYWHQDSQGDLRIERSQDVTRVLLGVDWTFDPIPL